MPVFHLVKKYFELIGLLTDTRHRVTTEKVQPGKCLREGAAGFLEMWVC